MPARVARERYIDFYLARNISNEWPRAWKMDLPEGYLCKRVFLQCARKTNTRFTNSIENEIASLEKVKTQFGLLVEDYFLQKHYYIFNVIHKATINDVFSRFIYEVKSEIEACSQRRSGWVIEGILSAFLNVTQYQLFRGRSYIHANPKKVAK